ncbi:DUF5682 family protein [Rhodopirellula baltica]|uniref:VWA containing CoxE family protein n=1 Tax=Rhodopirellula baltica SWK14 TaxID=993516 RepID=L7CPU2_RHOBT|nr:DUF5682 family protein [Rhodopirellula baltica]ELP35667.1 VWA containing CoxE family protein [Rhodopirellula baltica SWK14]
MQPLLQSRTPWLIGVRHHSAALARAMPAMLNDFAPECLLVELPGDLQDWIEHLADPQTIAPVAISAVHPEHGLFFYPLADFSPEWVAIRWAKQRGIPVVACDLSVAAKSQLAHSDSEEPTDDVPGPFENHGHHDVVTTGLDELLRRCGETDTGGLWQRLVESPGFGSDHESIRRAGLMFGWAVRESSPVVSHRDLLREAAMRTAIRQAPAHSAAVVGAFHAAALLPSVIESSEEQDLQLLDGVSVESSASVGVSLVPYSFEQLDERSGYPVGVRDPVWHQRMLESSTAEQADAASAELVTAICRHLRQQGHVAGMPDACESLRMMRDLARLRGLPVAGRGEMVEAIQSCLVQGDLMGRGRAVASAAESVLIGHRTGCVTPLAPRCGLAIEIDDQLAVLKLPGRESFGEESLPTSPRSSNRFQRGSRSQRDSETKEIKLDVLRSPRDRARAVVLRRFNAAGIPYAVRVDEVQQGHRENLVERWQIGWQQGTSATIESVSRYGVTLRQVVEGMVRAVGKTPGQAEAEAETLPANILHRLQIATQCGLVTLARQALQQLSGSFRQAAGLSQLVDAITVITQIHAGQVPGLPSDKNAAYPPWVETFALPDAETQINELLQTCLQRLSGIGGSNDPADVMAIVDLLDWLTGDLQAVTLSGDQTSTSESCRVQIAHWCRRTQRTGSVRMRGAAAAALSRLDTSPDDFRATETGDQWTALTRGWLDSAGNREGRQRLQYALAGATQVLLPQMQSDAFWLSGIQSGIAEMGDDVFLSRLPSLRGAFAEFSPADRQRLLQVCLSELDERGSNLDSSGASLSSIQEGDSAAITDELVRLREADLAGKSAIDAAYPECRDWLQSFRFGNQSPGEGAHPSVSSKTSESSPSQAHRHNDELNLADRWRLIFGLPPESGTPLAMRCASSLDQLYGRGHGEGSRGGLANAPSGMGGGTEAPEPTTAQWAEDLEALFGSDLCQEVLGTAAGNGRSTAIELLDPDTVTPSLELLQQVLSLAGAMPESKVATLRRLARRLAEQLASELAVRLQPAMNGLSSPRPTRRRARKLNLPRTLRDNLANCHRRADGRATIVAEKLMFHSPSKRQMDWHVTFVVDVSASMSASVIYSALVAAVFDALPALSVRFLAFSTEVLDFSEQVADPLSLLLEVQVGGGTDIGLGLRAARAGVTVPSRSIVILVSDFEEGVSVGRMIAEVRELVDAGVKCLGLASLDDSGVARFHQGYAAMMAGAGMPVAAVSPEKLARWVGDQIRGTQQATNPSAGLGGIE